MGLLSYRIDFHFHFREHHGGGAMTQAKSKRNLQGRANRNATSSIPGQLIEDGDTDREEEEEAEEAEEAEEEKEQQDLEASGKDSKGFPNSHRRLFFSVKDAELRYEDQFMYDLGFIMKQEQRCREFNDHIIGGVHLNDEDIDNLMHRKLQIRLADSSSQRSKTI